MEKTTRELLSKIKIGDYIRCYYMVIGHPVYTEGLVTYITSISYVIDSNRTLYYIDIDELEITHPDWDLGL